MRFKLYQRLIVLLLFAGVAVGFISLIGAEL
jgi:hypothetical protein